MTRGPRRRSRRVLVALALYGFLLLIGASVRAVGGRGPTDGAPNGMAASDPAPTVRAATDADGAAADATGTVVTGPADHGQAGHRARVHPPPSASAGTRSPPGTFVETFDGNPLQPESWDPGHWDVAVHSRDQSTWHALEPVDAAHAHDCGPPPATHGVTAYEDTVFSCRDHVMTSITAGGYAAIYLTPDHLVDFSDGEAVVRVDVSTLRSSGRDWWDIWLTPYEDNLQAPLEAWFPDLAGPPRRALQIALNESNTFIPRVYSDHREQVLPSDWSRPYDHVLTPDAKRRDTFELRVSRTHVRFGMPAHDWWPVDTPITDLGWDTAVVQFGHHSYNPTKDGHGGQPGTWHWDNVEIAPARPFTVIEGDRRYVDPTSPSTVNFVASTPAGAHLRFSGMGERFEVSFDGGATWEDAQRPSQAAANGLLYSNYWTPIPEGVQQVQVRGHPGWLTSWIAKDFAVWSHTAP